MLKICSETVCDGKDNLTDSVQWKGVGDPIPSNHTESEVFSLGVTQMNAQHTETLSNSLAVKTEWISKESSENAVSQTKQSDMIVCYEHGASQSIKDIFLVDNLHSSQKSLLGNDDANKISSGSDSSATNSDDHLSCTINEDTASMPQDLESAFIKGNKPPWSISENCENSNTAEQIRINKENRLEMLLPLEDIIGVPHHAYPTNFDISNDMGQSIHQEVVEEVVESGILSRENVPLEIAESKGSSKLQDNPAINSSEVTLEEGHSETEVASSDAASSITKENPLSDEMKTGETDVDLTSHAAREIDEERREHTKHIVQIHNNSAAEDTNSDGANATASARSSLYQKDHSDLKSGPFYLSGPKISSAHIAYSGSISLRSDSSTTSTRSFAFPVLQTEWNTSPVKMAKADRGRLRRCWLRTGIFCCKF